MKMVINGYSETQGIRFLKEMAAQGRFIFSVEDANRVSDQIGIGSGYIREMLSQLYKSGWIHRLRRGLYAWSGTLPGDMNVHPFAIATQLVQPSAISHWSAMNHYGFTDQIPQIVMASTPSKVVTPSMRRTSGIKQQGRHYWEIGAVRYEYITIKSEYFFGIEEVWIDQTFKVAITDPERTLLDLFAQPRLFGGIGEALAVLQEYVMDIDVNRLINYAVRYAKGSVIKRLGWSLEQVGVSSDVLVPLMKIPTAGYRILDPSRPYSGPYDNRWGIQNNLDVKAGSSGYIRI